MILRSALVRNARLLSIPEPVQFNPAKVNIVSGPNGSGKSTLFEMMRHAFLTNFNSSAATISALQPWNTEEAPFIDLLFEHGGRHYRVEKQFLLKPFSRLQIEESGGKWRDLQNQKGADEMLRSFVRSSGTGDPGLFSALWCPQGELPLVSLGNNVLEDVRSFLGAQVSGQRGADIDRRVKVEWDKYLTATGRSKKDSPIAELEVQLAQARKRAEHAQQALDSVKQYSADGTAKRERLATVEVELLKVLDDLAPLVRDESRYKALHSQVEVSKLKRDAAQGQYRKAFENLEIVKSLRHEIQLLVGKLPDLSAAAQQAGSDWRACSEEESRCREVIGRLAEFDQLASDADAKVNRANQWHDLRNSVRRIEQRIAAVAEKSPRKSEIAALLIELQAPDDKTLTRIRTTKADLERQMTKLEALFVRMDLELSPEFDYEILEGKAVETGSAVTGVGKIGIRIQGVGEVRVVAPAGEAAAIDAKIVQLQQEFAALCAPYGSQDLQALDGYALRRTQLEQERRDIDFEVRTLLDGRSTGDWQTELENRKVETDSILAKEPDWAAVSPDAEELRRQARAIHEKSKEERLKALAADTSARTALSHAIAAKNQVESKVRQANEKLEELRRNIARDESDGMSLSEREAAVFNLRTLAESENLSQAALQNELSEFAPDFPTRLAALRERQRQLESDSQKLNQEILAAESAQRALLQQASYSELAKAEEEITELEREIAEQSTTREAIRLLYETIETQREAALENLPGPVAEAMSQIVEEFAGRPFGRIDLDNNFFAQSVAPVNGPKDRELLSFSGGEQEQVHLALRLALADQCAAKERQVMVFDDALLNTDSVRLKRVFRAIEQRSGRIQFVILTCHPERYEDLADVNLIQLEQGFGAAA